jgi:hypothetical protein
MRKKDVRTVHRRFACFYANWKEFQLKDLVVKRVAIGDTETTFHPVINELSVGMLPQNRQKIWERDLPRKLSQSTEGRRMSGLSINNDIQQINNDYYKVAAPSNQKNIQNFKSQLRKSID